MKCTIAIINLCLIITFSFLAAGCVEDMSAAQKGAIAGAAAGGAAGGLIGGDRHSTLVGAGMGAIGGALLNEEIQRRK